MHKSKFSRTESDIIWGISWFISSKGGSGNFWKGRKGVVQTMPKQVDINIELYLKILGSYINW